MEEQLMQLITGLGLPTVAVIFLWKKMTEDNKRYIDLLKEGIENNKKTNEKLLETNGKFAEEIVKINTRIDTLDEKVDDIMDIIKK